MAERNVSQEEANGVMPCEDDRTLEVDQTLGLAGGTAGSNVAGGSGGANPEGGTGAANRAGGTGGANLAGGTGGANPGEGFYAEGAQDHPAHTYKWLYGEACTRGVKGRSRMNKAELEEALKR